MIVLQPWSTDALPILEQTLGNAEMMQHLGGVETPEQITRRHERYLKLVSSGNGGMYKIALGVDCFVVGTVGFWETTWNSEQIYEAGWMVLPEHAGRGIATEAARGVLLRARAQGNLRFLHAFPAVANVASNVVCAKAGFTKVGECVFEYPKGNFMRCNDWYADLGALEAAT